jgi:rubredoxin
LPQNPVNRLCPLCQLANGGTFFQDGRDYFRCPVCQLVFVSPRQFLSAQEEKAEYDLHQNSAADPRYRRFLSRLFEPLSQRLTPHSSGLDFGSGPGPTLSVMFEEAGHRMAIYDRFYAPDAAVFTHSYDFITASEVVEHLHYPRRELDRLWSCLQPNGWLGIMTKRVIDREAFAAWHYKNDLTHVCFFAAETFHWLANDWGATLILVDQDVALFGKEQLSQ